MVQKLFIWFLIFTFFASTTALPFYLHECKMVRALSFGVCRECIESDMPEKCETDTKSSTLSLSVTSSFGCCTGYIIDKKVNDCFLSFLQYSKKLIPNENNFLVSYLESPYALRISTSIAARSNHPHVFFSSELYLLNSILLI